MILRKKPSETIPNPNKIAGYIMSLCIFPVAPSDRLEFVGGRKCQLDHESTTIELTYFWWGLKTSINYSDLVTEFQTDYRPKVENLTARPWELMLGRPHVHPFFFNHQFKMTGNHSAICDLGDGEFTCFFWFKGWKGDSQGSGTRIERSRLESTGRWSLRLYHLLRWFDSKSLKTSQSISVTNE